MINKKNYKEIQFVAYFCKSNKTWNIVAATSQIIGD